ncbi:hypothetical protein MMO38_07150 [Acinetobacter sp. NIPH 1852]|uniref:hypothetical protein n=1 Tax=unclassified Acinetobacter TaxID=196816 RepID=UPI0002CE7581|nr:MULTISPECIES: hypothetical protein [unclassified Acinetobacter]ENU30104.1 hypothetical protein F991_01902 [Acinetobacter sp. CIP-A165]MCH7307918.1 hypothetical protein [Acinetobacter sp. NIPH 1852]MDR7015338.1 hypothetical protein [Prolinoborus sp. 3657]
MKIAYLGGFKDGEVLVVPVELSDPVQLNWVIQHDDVRKAEQDLVDHSNRDFTLTMKKNLINYHLMLLKKDKETRLFYVEEDLSKVKISERMNEHWEKSHLVGFDFD